MNHTYDVRTIKLYIKIQQLTISQNRY